MATSDEIAATIASKTIANDYSQYETEMYDWNFKKAMEVCFYSTFF
jgi:hypothetical protein